MTDDTARAALKPCPLCGGPAEIWRAHPERPKRNAWIACMGGCLVLTKEFETDAEAIAAWNTRATQLPAPGTVHICADCDCDQMQRRCAPCRSAQTARSAERADGEGERRGYLRGLDEARSEVRGAGSQNIPLEGREAFFEAIQRADDAIRALIDSERGEGRGGR